jgi:GT2 family glycosyltransferase
MSSIFSIVMLTYNNFEKFERCIMSMTPYFLDSKVLEIIILDNGSSGNLITFLENLEKNINKIKVIYSGKNLGVAGGRKILFSKAKADIIISVDSDTVILDHRYFLVALENNLAALPWEENGKKEGFYLLGGGGGNHIHYPSLYTNDVVHTAARNKKNEFVLVAEVAGWCHCFRRSLLEKVKMDETFSPFWGEDTDFCVQINKLGGKMAIFGRGVIHHAFSTCRDMSKKQKQDIQWEKVIEKWHPVNKYMDVEWYKKQYETDTPIQDYLTDTGDGCGILEGRLNPQIIGECNVDLVLSDNIMEFEKVLSLDHLVNNMYTFTKSCSLNNGPDIYIVHPDALETLEEHIDNIVVFVSPENYKTIKIPDNLKFRLILTPIDIPQDPYVMVMLAVLNLSNRDFENVKLIGYDLPAFDMSMNRKGIRKFIRDGNEEIRRPPIFDYGRVKKIVNQTPVNKVLRSNLLVPYDYSNTWCPEYSPRHILPELFLRIYNHHSWKSSSGSIREEPEVKPFLTVIVNNGDLIDDEFGQVREIRKFSDILYLSTNDSINKIPDGINYYRQMENYSLLDLFQFLTGNKMFMIYDYDYIVVFDNQKFQLLRDLKEFYHLSKYQDQIMIKGDPSLFSISVAHLDDKVEKFVQFCLSQKDNKVNDKPIDPRTLFSNNFTHKLYFSYIWRKEVEKSIDDEIVFYYRDDEKGKEESDLMDFPLVLK